MMKICFARRVYRVAVHPENEREFVTVTILNLIY